MKDIFKAIGGLVVAVAIGYFFLSGIAPDYSNGFRVGVVQKTSLKGMLVKSYEGQMVLKGFRNNQVAVNNTSSNTITNVWEFSVSDPDVALEIENSTGSPVKLTYRQWFIKPWWQATTYDIVSVEQIKAPKIN